MSCNTNLLQIVKKLHNKPNWRRSLLYHLDFANRAHTASDITTHILSDLESFKKTGVLIHVQEKHQIWEQFPILCPETRKEGSERIPAKITLHQGLLRVGSGSQHVMEPDVAQSYFSRTCSGRKCDLIQHFNKQLTPMDLNQKTPHERWYFLTYVMTMFEQDSRTFAKE